MQSTVGFGPSIAAARKYTEGQRFAEDLARRTATVQLLRERRRAVVEAWGEECELHPERAADVDEGSPLDRMWRLTAAIDLAILRQGGEV